MKILHVIDYFQPKLGYQETFLAKEQMKAGHEVHVITSDRYYPFPNYDKSVKDLLGERILKPGTFTEEGITVHRLPIYFEIFCRACLKGLSKKVQEINPDTIHCHGISSTTAVTLAKLKPQLNFSLLCDDHMLYSVINEGRWFKQAFYALFRLLYKKRLLKNVDYFVGVTGETKDFMHEFYQIPKDRIDVILLGADTDLFQFDDDKRKKLRAEWEVEDDEVVVIYAGKVIPPKGPHILVDALIPLMKENKKLKLVIVGKGDDEYLNKMKGKLEVEGLSRRVIWHPPVKNTELPSYYCAADMGAWPLQESLTMLEAQACQLPVIVKDSPVGRERTDKSGLLYQEGNADNMREKLLILIQDPDKRKAMGQSGRRLVENSFSWTAINEQFMKLYKKD